MVGSCKIFLSVILIIEAIDCKPFIDECSDSNEYCPNVYSTLHQDKSIIRKAVCELCYLTLPIARSLIINNRTSYLPAIIAHLCNDLKISDSIVCEMAVNEYTVSFTSF